MLSPPSELKGTNAAGIYHLGFAPQALRCRRLSGWKESRAQLVTGDVCEPVALCCVSGSPHRRINYGEARDFRRFADRGFLFGYVIMPVHDWSQVFDGAFHDFHLAWIAELRNRLNSGLLPPDYYALAEQVAGPAVPDFLTLQATNGLMAINGLASRSPGPRQ
jgi:hypothetical protein